MKRLLNPRNSALLVFFVGLASLFAALFHSAGVQGETSVPIGEVPPNAPRDLWLILFCLSAGEHRYQVPAAQLMRVLPPELRNLSFKGDF